MNESMFQDPFSGWIIKKILDKAYEHTIKASGRLVSKWRARNQVDNWIPRLNNYLNTEMKIFCQNTTEPIITIVGPYPLTQTQRTAAKIHRKRLKKINRPNDPHAILINDPLWDSDPVHFSANTLDFASVCALRDEGIKPQILSSCAVIVCNEDQQLILHERAEEVATHPGCLHTLGGAYIPPGCGGVDCDRLSLISTNVREVHEEAQVSLLSDLIPPMMLSIELSTGFIQLVFLGHNISSSAAKRLESNWEGKITPVSFNNLPTVLQNPKWVPTGKGHILAWLALGTPGCSEKPKFKSLSASQLFNTIVR